MGLDSLVRSLIPLPTGTTTTTLMSLTRGYNNNLLDCFMGVVLLLVRCVFGNQDIMQSYLCQSLLGMTIIPLTVSSGSSSSCASSRIIIKLLQFLW